jgi:F420-0:gamma-glutamyl ligase-like protein
MRPDFDAVNDVLSSLVPRVEAAVGQLSPAIGLLDKAGGRADAFAISRVIAVARDMAWRNALELTSLATSERAGAVDHIDAEVAEMAHAMVHPGLAMSSLFLPIRAMERRSLGESMDVLGSIDAEP